VAFCLKMLTLRRDMRLNAKREGAPKPVSALLARGRSGLRGGRWRGIEADPGSLQEPHAVKTRAQLSPSSGPRHVARFLRITTRCRHVEMFLRITYKQMMICTHK
jgi:hypothetical protein